MTESRTNLPIDALDAEPQTIHQLISPHRELLRSALDAYWQCRHAGREARFGPILLWGDPLLGRMLTASILCRELGLELNWLCGSAAMRREDVINTMMAASKGMLIVQAEYTPLTSTCQSLLLPILSDRRLPITGEHQSVDWSAMTVVVIVERPVISAALLRQFRLILRFNPYSQEDIARIIQQRAAWLKWELSGKAFDKCVECSVGYPGVAIWTLDAARLLARQDGREEIGEDDIGKAFDRVDQNRPTRPRARM